MSGPNYKVRNRNTIKKAFDNFRKYVDGVCEVVVRNITRDGIQQLVDAHRMVFGLHDGHPMHLIEENTLGYAIAHDGVIVESGYHKGSGAEPLPGEAVEMARYALEGTIGWCGIVISDLVWSHYDDHEEDMQRYAIDVIRDRWDGGVFGESAENIRSIYVIPGSIPKPE